MEKIDLELKKKEFKKIQLDQVVTNYKANLMKL